MKEELCAICKYGDGKWEERSELPPFGSPVDSLPPKKQLPICELCKADGWTDNPKEVAEAIKNDPDLDKIISTESPYFKK